MSKNKSKQNRQVSDNQGYFNPDISGVQQSEDYRKET